MKPIIDKYNQYFERKEGPLGAQLPSENVLGFPTQDITPCRDGIGFFQHYKSGEKKLSSIYWHPDTGAHTVWGAIRTKWERSGGERGRLGYPVTDEIRTPDQKGVFQHFQQGSIYHNPELKTGEHILYGKVRGKWAAAGWEGGRFGYPLEDVQAYRAIRETQLGTKKMVTIDDYEYCTFQHGIIYSNPRAENAILLKYKTFGGEQGFLGKPTEDFNVCPDGSGFFQHYQGGSIYWHPNTGANLVIGSIRHRWAELGWEGGVLGYPTNDETSTPDNRGRFNQFQRGCIYWTKEHGACELPQDVADKWAEMGWEQSYLGFPVRDEKESKDLASKQYFSFEGGQLFRKNGGVLPVVKMRTL